MIVSLPEDLDILYYYDTDGSRKMAVKLGEDVLGPVASKGAFVPLSDMMMKARPEVFTDSKSTQMSLTLLHFRFMDTGQNRSGMLYPYHLGTSS